MKNFKVGDEVRITDKESVYSTYSAWAEMVKAKNWRDGFTPENGSIGKITKLDKHLHVFATIALVDIDGTDVIIGLNGFELITRPKSFDNPEVGDVYSNVNGNKVTVLGVAGRVIFLSDDNQDNYNMGCTKEELIEFGYIIESNVEEITMKELIKELGREVKIKI